MGMEQRVVKEIAGRQRCLVKANLTTLQLSERRLRQSYHKNCTMTDVTQDYKVYCVVTYRYKANLKM